jgi:hypothetical protein
MLCILTVGRSYRLDTRTPGSVRRYQYPDLRISAPILRAVGLKTGDRVQVRAVGARIIVERLTRNRTPSRAGAPQARRRRSAVKGRKRRAGR